MLFWYNFSDNSKKQYKRLYKMEYSWFRYSKLWKPYCIKSKVLRFIRPKANCFFNCLNPKGIKLITKLRVGFSHLRDHKFKHSFHDCLNHIAAVVLKSKQLFIICFTVPTTYMKEKPFWATSNLPFLIFWNKMTLLLMFLSLVILL